MLTKCADSQTGSGADNKKHITGKARRDGAGGNKEEGREWMNYKWKCSKFPSIPPPPPFLFYTEKCTFFPCKSTSALYFS